MVLTFVFWRYRMIFDAHGCVFTLMIVTFHAKILIESDKTLMSVDSLKWMHFRVYEFEVSDNYSIFSGNEQQKV